MSFSCELIQVEEVLRDRCSSVDRLVGDIDAVVRQLGKAGVAADELRSSWLSDCLPDLVRLNACLRELSSEVRQVIQQRIDNGP